MRTVFEKASEVYTVTALRAGNWAEFKDFYQSLKTPAFFVDNNRDVSDPVSWKSILAGEEAAGKPLFALWHKDRIIGMGGILYEDHDDPNDRIAILSRAQIADDYLRNGLSSILYDVSRNYLKETGFKGAVEAYIEPDNIPSIRMAEKYGFEFDRQTYVYDIYRLRDEKRDFAP